MLEGLDEVEWHELKHAYGAADDVPDLIRALTSSSEDEREEAYQELYGNIWHQGTVYEATAYVVPFLIELAASSDTPDRHMIVSYLGTLADGSSYINAHKDAIEFSRDELSNQLPTELKWVEKTRNAVKAGGDLYLLVLTEGEQQLSLAAAYALSRFPEEGGRYWRPLQELFARSATDPVIRCGIAILSRPFTSNQPAVGGWLYQSFQSEADPSVRTALASSIAWDGNKPPDDVTRTLVDEILADDALEDLYRTQPFDLEEPMMDIIHALCATKQGRHLAASRFNELLSQGADQQRLEDCHYCLHCELSDENIFYTVGDLKPILLPI